MLTHYLTLDVSPAADDETIRRAYLALVRKHTPEKDPVRFGEITQAYDAIKNREARVAQQLFGSMRMDLESGLHNLIRSRKNKKRRVTLKELFDESLPK